jgi:hypothetical protein
MVQEGGMAIPSPQELRASQLGIPAALPPSGSAIPQSAEALPAVIPPPPVGVLGTMMAALQQGKTVSPSVPIVEQFEILPLPDILTNEINQLELWAQRNLKESKQDSSHFWMLKVPAIVLSAAAGILAHINAAVTSAVSIVAGVFVGLDGYIKGGKLRAVHLRAYHELRTLQNDIQAAWKLGCLRGVESRELVATIIENTEKQKKLISEYLKGAEATPLD